MASLSLGVAKKSRSASARHLCLIVCCIALVCCHFSVSAKTLASYRVELAAHDLARPIAAHVQPLAEQRDMFAAQTLAESSQGSDITSNAHSTASTQAADSATSHSQATASSSGSNGVVSSHASATAAASSSSSPSSSRSVVRPSSSSVASGDSEPAAHSSSSSTGVVQPSSSSSESASVASSGSGSRVSASSASTSSDSSSLLSSSLSSSELSLSSEGLSSESSLQSSSDSDVAVSSSKASSGDVSSSSELVSSSSSYSGSDSSSVLSESSSLSSSRTSSSSSSVATVGSSSSSSSSSLRSSSDSAIVLTYAVTRRISMVYSEALQPSASAIIESYSAAHGVAATVAQEASAVHVEGNAGYWQQADAASSSPYYRSFLSVTTDVGVLDAFTAAANGGRLQGVVLVESWEDRNSKASKLWIIGIVIAAVASIAAEVLIVLQIVYKRHHRQRRTSVYSEGAYDDLEMASAQHNAAVSAAGPPNSAPPLPVRERRTKW